MSNDERKYIVIAVSGGIAAFRTCDLVRNLKKKGYPVQVVMTENAMRFIGKITFAALSDRPVYTSAWGEGMEHIDLKNMAAVFAVVPATANIIGKMAGGIADDLVTSTYLALQCPVYIAPSMNPGMYASAPVRRNLATLQGDGVQIMEPADGEVVCGDVGRGKMAEVSKIEQTLIDAYEKNASRGSAGDSSDGAVGEPASSGKTEIVFEVEDQVKENPTSSGETEIVFEIQDQAADEPTQKEEPQMSPEAREIEEDEIIVMQEETVVIDDEGNVREGW